MEEFQRRPTPPVLYAVKSGPPEEAPQEAETTLLLRKLITRVERIDQEVGVLAHAVEGRGKEHAGIRHDIIQLCSDVRSLDRKLEAIKDLLADALVR